MHFIDFLHLIHIIHFIHFKQSIDFVHFIHFVHFHTREKEKLPGTTGERGKLPKTTWYQKAKAPRSPGSKREKGKGGPAACEI